MKSKNSKNSIRTNKQKADDRLMLFMDKSKIKLSLFQLLMSNYSVIKRIILRNGITISFDDISGKLMYIKTNIKKYEDLIASYRIEHKDTNLFVLELENLHETESILTNELLDRLEKHLLKTKEIVVYNPFNTKNYFDDIHILISDKNLHSLEYPAIFSESYSTLSFYINGEKFEEDEWKHHPLVRQNKIKSILKNSKY